ncbi:MAG: phage minor head protein [Peptostreptococcaceae bacterium]|nr:phage minor head protein [Peptostreptococcaceae bacterium]
MHKEFEKLQQAVEELLKLSEGKILFEYAVALERLRTMVRKIYDKHETGGKVSMIEMGKYDRLHKMEQEIEQSLKQLYKKNGRLMDETLKNIFVLTRDTTLQSVAKGVPEEKKSLLAISKKLDIDATVNEKMAGLHWAERMGKHRSDVIYGVNKTLKEGLAQGSTYKELSDRLKKEMEGNVVQPMRIIRTESGRVYARTQQESLDRVADAGIKMVKTWKSSKDERVRSQHQEMEGVTIPYEEEFTLPDGTKTTAPRLSGAPQHDIHCRCFITIDLAENRLKGEDRGYLFTIDLQLFVNKDIEKQTERQLKKGIRSYEKQIQRHKDKIDNPSAYVEGWESYSEKRKEGLKRHWEKEIQNFQKNIADNMSELKKRGETHE